MLLTLVLGSASDSCNNKDILLVVGFNYNLLLHLHCHSICTYVSQLVKTLKMIQIKCIYFDSKIDSDSICINFSKFSGGISMLRMLIVLRTMERIYIDAICFASRRIILCPPQESIISHFDPLDQNPERNSGN